MGITSSKFCRKMNMQLKIVIALLLISTSSLFALGTLTLGQNTLVGCQPGYTCQQFTVTAPGIPVYRDSGSGTFETRHAATGSSGTIVFFSGSAGTGWYMPNTTPCNQLLDQLIALDYDIIQVKWGGNGWIATQPGMVVGQSILAQRPATVIYWLKANRARGRRYIIAGGSNGATQITYSLAFYGVGSITDLAIPISGPPYMEIDKGCSQVAGYGYPAYAEGFVDSSYGHVNNLTFGPCYNHDPSWFEFERVNSVGAGLSYNYPGAAVKILLGLLDDRFIKNRGQDYYNLLAARGQRRLSIMYVPNTGHSLQETQQGLDAIKAAITQP